MSAYPMRVSDPETDPRREQVADLFDHVATAIRSGYRFDLRARLQWAIESLKRLEPEAVATAREQIEDDYPERIRRCQTVQEALMVHEELLALYHAADQLDYEALAQADALCGKD